MPIRRSRRWIAVLAGSLLAVVFLSWGALSDHDVAPNPNASLSARLQKTIAGHSKGVWQVVFSPDGQYLASCSVDRTVQLRRVPDGELVQTLTQPVGITSIAFSPDGQYLASGGYDQTVRVWRLRDGALERTLTGHEGTVWSVAFSSDGHRLASSGEDKTVRIWRLVDGAALQTLVGHTLTIWSVAFSPDGHWLASGSFDRTAKLWRVDTGALVRTLSGHSQAVVEIAFSPDSQLLATGSDDSSIKLWRVNEGTLVNTLRGGSEHVYSVAFSPDGQWLASGSREKGTMGTLWKQLAGDRLSTGRGKTVRLWRVRDGDLQQTLVESSGDVHSVAFSPDGRWLASSGDDRVVRLWRLESLAPLRPERSGETPSNTGMQRTALRAAAERERWTARAMTVPDVFTEKTLQALSFLEAYGWRR